MFADLSSLSTQAPTLSSPLSSLDHESQVCGPDPKILLVDTFMLLVSKLKAVEGAVLSQDELQMAMQKLMRVNSYIQVLL